MAKYCPTCGTELYMDTCPVCFERERIEREEAGRREDRRVMEECGDWPCVCGHTQNEHSGSGECQADSTIVRIDSRLRELEAGNAP